jgi:6-phosphofructokinase 1
MMSTPVLAIATPGGDAPGMNMVIRSITIHARAHGFKVLGVQHGTRGLITGDFIVLTNKVVEDIGQRPGTILGSARTHELETDEGLKKALMNLSQHGVTMLVVVGGNGSQQLAYALHRAGFPVMGVAATIDNDLVGSDPTIGFDTALNVALIAVDQLKITASAFERVFMIETMGRKCGSLALMTALAANAQAVVIGEKEIMPEDVAEIVRSSYRRGQSHCIIVVAEGAKYNAEKLERYFIDHQEILGFELRTARLGHMQRAGTPTAFDRILASRLGMVAVEALARHRYGGLVGIRRGKAAITPLAEIAGQQKTIDVSVLKAMKLLVR